MSVDVSAYIDYICNTLPQKKLQCNGDSVNGYFVIGLRGINSTKIQ